VQVSRELIYDFLELARHIVKILYLENHAIFAQQVISQFLKSHQVTVVPTLAAARQTLASNSFDLVLSDYDLDDAKGDEFVRECRTAHPHLPIIAVSSHEAGNAALMRAGASAVCSKMEFQPQSFRNPCKLFGFEHFNSEFLMILSRSMILSVFPPQLPKILPLSVCISVYPWLNSFSVGAPLLCVH